MSKAGYHFEPGSEAECFDGYEDAVEEGRWVVLPLWHPQYLHFKHRIRPLKEPMGLLGGTDDATLIVRKDAKGLVAPAALSRLASLSLGNDVVTMLDYEIRKEGKSPLSTAWNWLASGVLPA